MLDILVECFFDDLVIIVIVFCGMCMGVVMLVDCDC